MKSVDVHWHTVFRAIGNRTLTRAGCFGVKVNGMGRIPAGGRFAGGWSVERWSGASGFRMATLRDFCPVSVDAMV